MGYIMNLREKVGHDPIIGVGATTLVFNIKNELLLNLRSDTNNWGIPGGAKELNETLEECAREELADRVLRKKVDNRNNPVFFLEFRRI